MTLAGAGVLGGINLNARTASMETKWALHEPITEKGLADIQSNAMNTAVVQQSIAQLNSSYATIRDAVLDIAKELKDFRIEVAARRAGNGFPWDTELAMP